MLYDWLQHIEFKNDWVLPFLLLLPVLAWIWWRGERTFQGAFTVPSANAFTARSLRNAFVYVPLLMRLLAVASVLLAIARPQVREVQSRTEGEGIAVMLCLDVSGSMLSQDFVPTRLDVAKEVAADFVRMRPVDQIGLVVFAGESFTQFPVSTDREGLLAQIAALKSGMLEDGTLIGEGLATAVKRLDAVTARSKIVVLLTDGKEEAPDTRIIDPATALEIAKAKGVKVYTIGMGSDHAVPVSEARRGQVFDRNTAFIDESLLQRIAAQTGGDYFRARDRESLQNIYAQIDRLEKSEVDVITRTRFGEEYGWFLGAALALLLFELFLRFLIFRTFP
jgi:Ca-activated chloride channel family protein